MSTAAAALGKVDGVDSEALPQAARQEFPWRFAAALAAAYLFAYFGWHWAYVLPLFWILAHMDERRQRQLWVRLQDEAAARASASHTAESVNWINQLVRAVWPMYEAGIGRWCRGKIQPILDEYPLAYGTLRVKSFSFGTLESRKADNSHQAAPFIFDNVQMVSKSVPNEKTIRWGAMPAQQPNSRGGHDAFWRHRSPAGKRACWDRLGDAPTCRRGASRCARAQIAPLSSLLSPLSSLLSPLSSLLSLLSSLFYPALSRAQLRLHDGCALARRLRQAACSPRPRARPALPLVDLLRLRRRRGRRRDRCGDGADRV